MGEFAACRGMREQHLMAHCDTCDPRYHLACLSPPLAKCFTTDASQIIQCKGMKESGEEAIAFVPDTSVFVMLLLL